MTKRILYILLFFTYSSAFAGLGDISFASRDPKYGMVGISFTGIRPLGGAGHLFDEDNDTPHGEFGLAGGFDFWKKYYRTYDFHVGLEGKYQQYHFHYGQDELDGYFRFVHLSAPVTIHFPLKNYPYIFFKGGFALSSMNLLNENSGKVGDQSYISEFETAWPVYPELILGIDFLEEKGRKAFMRVGIDYTFVPLSSMGEFKAYVWSGNELKQGTGSFNPSKFQLKITIYPVWKRIVLNRNTCPGG